MQWNAWTEPDLLPRRDGPCVETILAQPPEMRRWRFTSIPAVAPQM